MERKQFEKCMKDILGYLQADFVEKGLQVFDKMTDAERQMMGSESSPFRLPKAVLVALVENGLIDRQWNAEGIKSDVRRLITPSLG